MSSPEKRVGTRSRCNSLSHCNYGGSGFISGRHQPWSQRKWTKECSKSRLGEKRGGTLKNNTVANVERRIIRCTVSVMLQGKDPGKPEFKVSSGVSVLLSPFFSFRSKYRLQVHFEKKAPARAICCWKSPTIFPGWQKLEKKTLLYCHQNTDGAVMMLVFWLGDGFRAPGAAFPRPHE